jgi:hypothetical protein
MLWRSAEQAPWNDDVTTCPSKDKPMIQPPVEARWRELESNAHLPDVQELIREEIQRGTIRVRPKPDGGIRIVPVGVPESEELEEMEALPAPSHEEASPSRRVGFRGRLARR